MVSNVQFLGWFIAIFIPPHQGFQLLSPLTDDLLADSHQYAIRYWQAVGFRDLKFHGWQ